MVGSALASGSLERAGVDSVELGNWMESPKAGRVHVLKDQAEALEWKARFIRSASLESLSPDLTMFRSADFEGLAMEEARRDGDPPPFFFMDDGRGLANGTNTHIVFVADAVRGIECVGDREGRIGFSGTYGMPDWFDEEWFAERVGEEMKEMFRMDGMGGMRLFGDSHESFNWMAGNWMDGSTAADRSLTLGILLGKVRSLIPCAGCTTSVVSDGRRRMCAVMNMDKMAWTLANAPAFLRGFLAHEVVTHIGLANILDAAQYGALVGAVREWIGNDTPVMVHVARSLSRSDGIYLEDEIGHEILAWYVEKAVEEDPDFLKGGTRGAEAALRKLDRGGGDIAATDISNLAWMAVKYVRENSDGGGVAIRPGSCCHDDYSIE